jgi:hypothetical protein
MQEHQARRHVLQAGSSCQRSILREQQRTERTQAPARTNSKNSDDGQYSSKGALGGGCEHPHTDIAEVTAWPQYQA